MRASVRPSGATPDVRPMRMHQEGSEPMGKRTDRERSETPVTAGTERIAYALVVREPYASDIASGKKRTEFRSWRTAYRGPLVIVQSRSGGGSRAGRCVCVVQLTECLRVEGGYAWSLSNPQPLPAKPVAGRVGLIPFNLERLEVIAKAKPAKALADDDGAVSDDEAMRVAGHLAERAKRGYPGWPKDSKRTEAESRAFLTDEPADEPADTDAPSDPEPTPPEPSDGREAWYRNGTTVVHVPAKAHPEPARTYSVDSVLGPDKAVTLAPTAEPATVTEPAPHAFADF